MQLVYSNNEHTWDEIQNAIEKFFDKKHPYTIMTDKLVTFVIFYMEPFKPDAYILKSKSVMFVAGAKETKKGVIIGYFKHWREKAKSLFDSIPKECQIERWELQSYKM